MFCQACREIPCLGTTHADHFRGPVPLARALTPAEVEEDYEGHTGSVIVERFAGPRSGRRAGGAGGAPRAVHAGAVPRRDGGENSVALEAVAEMALGTLQLEPEIDSIPGHILGKHYSRKHGPDATYGQRG